MSIHVGNIPKGKRVKIILRNGRKVVTRFIERDDRKVTTDAGVFLKRDIRAFSIYKPLPTP